ncbi:trypsin-like peptidase domain-containing protein [Parachitinimonas caeni]|uniref:Trypsin-like peptidase domain-containing protein n=1 Tax=Parachitinimonas caeni TaxID=3031301 RepID=A0ABT7E3P1_9NEIS|nr:trypsin-like peptidase domain-containing protein [Parachitinimonas caeni]MDK2126926.1 trypsin-like peptidase domain-containing protein [Parachitinimonas caeni]
MVELTAGANCTLSGPGCRFVLGADIKNVWEHAGIALLPLDEKRQPTGHAALLFAHQPWNSWQEVGADAGCSLQLDALPANTHFILLTVYLYGAAGAIRDLRELNLQVDDAIRYRLPVNDFGDAALVLAEFYRRGDQWKIRALAEGSAYGLAALGRRLGMEINDKHPDHSHNTASADDSAAQSSSDAPDHCEAASGTSFAVSSNHVLTCAHVIEDMRRFRITSLQGTYKAEPVVIDFKNDIALMRIDGAPPLQPVTFRDGPGISLGEPIITLGFPLAGLTGRGVQVTQGGVSALFGLHDDSRLLQFTAPIQPGSSGSPLFDMAGQVTGLVTSTITRAQNMNFAVKSSLLLSFLEAARVTPLRARDLPTKAPHELVRDIEASLWLLEVAV